VNPIATSRRVKRRLRPAEALTVGFSLLLLILSVYHRHHIPAAWHLVFIYGSLVLFQYLLVSLSVLNRFLSLTRDIIFPVMAVLVIFDSLELIVHAVNPVDLDYLLIRLDYQLLGVHPTVWLQAFTTPLLSDILQVGYSTYYFLAIGLGVYVRLKGDDEAFSKTVFFILLCFYLSYVGYLLVPALGPRYAMDHLHEGPLVGFLAAEPIQRFLNLMEGIKRDAFPSGHTAIALTVLYLAHRFAKRLFMVFLPCVILLVVSTVYCRYHYVVDVIAGVFLAVAVVIAGEVYYKFFVRSDRGVPPQRDIRGHFA